VNEWSQRTLEIVGGDYLDKLQTIYPNPEEETREASDLVKQQIDSMMQEQNCISLLNTLLDLEIFPFKDSYIAFLRKDRTSIERNPSTVDRICSKLFNMGYERVIEGITRPKEANTQRGQQFKKWLRNNFDHVNMRSFRQSTTGITVLQSSERDARDFCNQELGIGIAKRPDLVAKSGRHYVVGEAKFLSSSGGNQGRAFEDGMTLAINTQGSAYKAFILDGIHWIETGSEQYRRIQYGSAAVLSAMLLRDFFKSLL